MNILVSAYLDRNFGDDMMVRILANELKNHTIYISSRKELVIPFENIPNIKIYNNEDINFDLYLCATGSGFIINSKINLLYALLEHNKFKKYIKKFKKTLLIGCNVGPYINKIAKAVSFSKIKSFDTICTRDTISYNLLKSSLKKNNIYCYPDIVFATPKEWLPPNTNENCLGISAYHSITNPHLNYKNYTAMAKIADNYIEKTGNKVLIFAYDCETENDIIAAKNIKHLCKYKENIEIIMHLDNGDNIIKNTARCKSIIAVRFHSVVLALLMGIDFIPISYSDKHNNLLNDINFTNKVYNFENIDEINAGNLVNSIINDDNKFKIDTKIFENAKGHINKVLDKLK